MQKNEIRQGRFGLEPKLPSVQDPSRLVNTPAFMTDIPYNVLQEGKQKLNVPVMMGMYIMQPNLCVTALK